MLGVGGVGLFCGRGHLQTRANKGNQGKTRENKGKQEEIKGKQGKSRENKRSQGKTREIKGINVNRGKTR